MGVRIQSDDNGQLYPFRFVGALRCKVPNVILYDDRQIREIKAFCFAAESASVLSFDKTFNLGSIYVTPSVYKNTAVNRKRTGDHPIFLGPIFLHGHSDRQNYGMFFSHLSVLMMDCNQQALTLGSDDELALRHCMQAFFPRAAQISCTRHLQENVRRQLDERIGSRSELRRSLYNGLFGADGLTSQTDVISFDEAVERYRREAAGRAERLR